jgi:lipoyl(octanoyl) transferase
MQRALGQSFAGLCFLVLGPEKKRMSLKPPQPLKSTSAAVLQAYLLGSVDFEAALAFQRRLVYQISGERDSGCLILCEHPPLITVGRQGSRAHILFEPEELMARQWRIRWVNRGGGCLLHLPGQLAIYPILALDRLDVGLHDYLERLQQVVVAVLDDFSVKGETRLGHAGVWVGTRLVADIGVAVRNWVAYYGIALNINPSLELFRRVRTGKVTDGSMTSLERERRGPLRPALVRERLLEHFAARFSFSRVSVFSDHPSLGLQKGSDPLKSRGLTPF